MNLQKICVKQTQKFKIYWKNDFFLKIKLNLLLQLMDNHHEHQIKNQCLS